MTCEEFLRRLDDGRAPADPEPAEHARSCPACARALARWQAAQRELRAMSSEGAPPFLHARVMAHVRAEAAARRPRRQLRFVRTLLATAAVAVVAALAGYEVLRQRNVPIPPVFPTEARPATALPPGAQALPQETTGIGAEARPPAAPATRLAPPRLEAAQPLRKAAPPSGGRNLVGAVVACVLHTTVRGQTRLLDLPAVWAPPAGASWGVTIAADGAAAVADPRGVDITRRLSGLHARLAALGLPPGRYLLTRRSE